MAKNQPLQPLYTTNNSYRDDHYIIEILHPKNLILRRNIQTEQILLAGFGIDGNPFPLPEILFRSKLHHTWNVLTKVLYVIVCIRAASIALGAKKGCKNNAIYLTLLSSHSIAIQIIYLNAH
jgi:hypothetical protein